MPRSPVSNSARTTLSRADAPSYPVNLRLAGRCVVVVGGGNVARRKVAGLLASGAAVTVVAPKISPELRSDARLTCVERPYQPRDLDDALLVITCTDDPEVNAQVYRDGEAAGVWVNSADDPENCAFTLPAVARQGDLQVTISTAGRSPALAMWLRRRFEQEFDARWAELLDVLSTVRGEARTTLGTSEVPGWLDALDAGVFDLVAHGDRPGAEQLLREHLGLAA